MNHQRARKNVRKTVYDGFSYCRTNLDDGFSYCRTNLENSLCAKIDNQRDDDVRDDISNGKVDEKFDNQLAKAIAKKCDDNRKKSQIEPEPDEIEPLVQETDVDITGTVLKKFGKHRTVHDVIVPGELPVPM